MRRTTMNSWNALGSMLLVLVVFTIRCIIFIPLALVAMLLVVGLLRFGLS